jgi:hypothetical protein
MGLTKHHGPLLAPKRVFLFVGVTMDITTDGSFTVTAPTDRRSGDLLVAVYCEISNQTDPTTPSGWTLRGSADGRTQVFSRTADGTSADDLAIAATAGADGMAGILAVRAPGLPITYGTPDSTSGGGTLTVPSATATAAGDELLLVIARHDSTSIPSIATPNGFTLSGSVSDAVASSDRARFSVFHREVASAGAVGSTEMSILPQNVAAGVKVLAA